MISLTRLGLAIARAEIAVRKIVWSVRCSIRELVDGVESAGPCTGRHPKYVAGGGCSMERGHGGPCDIIADPCGISVTGGISSKEGWWCTRERGHDGPCAAIPPEAR